MLTAWWLLSLTLAAQTGGGDSRAATPASARAQSAFLEGVAALHSFEYEDANAAFVRAQRADPGLALAYWGEAMTYHQTLWGNEDLAAGRRALARVAATPAARAGAGQSPRDRMFLSAAGALFGDGDLTTRRQLYAAAMARLYDSEQSDPEAASFYALALLGTMSRSLIGHVDHEVHSASLAGSETQGRVASILGKVLVALQSLGVVVEFRMREGSPVPGPGYSARCS